MVRPGASRSAVPGSERHPLISVTVPTLNDAAATPVSDPQLSLL